VATKKLLRVPPGRASFCHAAEVARAHLAAVSEGRKGENYLLGGADASYATVVQTMAELIPAQNKFKCTPAFALRVVARVLEWASFVTDKEPLLTPESAAYLSSDVVCRTDKAIAELSYRPVPLRTMLEDCYHWMISEGLL
jgi:nucleoside-diphosphate-sugar epimerase